MKANLGCGFSAKKGYLNVDYVKFKGVDKVQDLNEKRWDFKDNTFSEILMYHVLEHLPDTVSVVNELWRITKPNGIIKIIVPYWSSVYQVINPTHVKAFSAMTFVDIFQERNHYFQGATFELLSNKIVFSGNKFLSVFNFFINRFQNIYERFFAHILVSKELHVTVKVVKN